MENTEKLVEYLHEQIALHVRSGYGSEERVMEAIEEQVRDELRNSGSAEIEPLLAKAQQRLSLQRRRETTWTQRTTNDRIDDAFQALNDNGIIALQDAGYTMSDGWSDIAEVHADEPSAWGATFFHRQDVERGVQGEGLMLAFGAFVEGKTHESESIRLGHEICEVLRKHGIEVEWSGSIKSRIAIAPFKWQKRRTTHAQERVDDR